MTLSLRAPRAANALVLALLLAFVLATVAPAASGQPTPAPSGSPSGPAEGELEVELLNPSTAYDDPPKISDRFDGADTRYTIAVRTTGSAESAIVEAYVAPQDSSGAFGNDRTIGELTRVSEASDVWQLEWDIPPSFPEGLARVTVRAFVETPGGFVESGSDSVEAEIFYSDPTQGPVGAWETVDLKWPEQDGPFGWYKPRVGAWRAVFTGTTSAGASHVQMLVSVSPPGQPLTFTPCGSAAATQAPGAAFRTFTGECTLSALDLPSTVRAVAVVAEFRNEATGVRFLQGADVSAVQSYDVKPENMQITLAPQVLRAPAPATACHAVTATVTDEYGNLILGANVDLHATGPTESLTIFETGLVAPEGHPIEQTPVCPGGPPVVPTTPLKLAEHNVPGAVDTKHMEMSAGSGLDYPALPTGQAIFRIASAAPGFTDLTAWVDDEEIRRQTDQRPSDSDTLDAGEPVAHSRIQWLGAPLTLSLDPVGGTAAAGTCFPYTVKARSGTDPAPAINVDVHATGPDDDLDFCDPAGALPRRAPERGSGATAHEAEEVSESHHFASTGPDSQHTEGETDSAGNFVVGLTSPVTGDSSIVAWLDGEPGADDDVQGATETSSSGTISWATATGEAELGFINPSPYGGGGVTQGNGAGTQVPDSGGSTTILVRVDMATHVPGVEVLLSTDNRKTYDLLGEAERVGSTDLYRLPWRIGLPDGVYGLRARIEGTSVVEDIDVKVGAGDLVPMVPAPAYESLRILKPDLASGVPFTRRATVVSGRASAGAEGVDVFYTKVPAKDTPQATDWIFCGYAGLSGTGTSQQEFSTPCTLKGADQASQVTGIAAITYDCTADGCDANPTPPPPASGSPAAPPREPGQKDTGQALRVFGYEASPLLALEPPETEAITGECRRMQLLLRDQTGQPIEGENVDLHLTTAGGARFCRPSDAAPGLRAPRDGGHVATGDDPAVQLEASHEGGDGTIHTEADTLPDGSVVFGVTSPGSEDVQLTGWLDRNDDDVQGADEPADTALLHWVAPQGCSVVGSPGPDVLRGTRGKDVFCGFEGNDVLKGLRGADVVFGGPGRDVIRGGAGRDTLRGGIGQDLLDGGRGRDTCRGGRGRDRLVRCESGSREPGRRVAPRRSGV
ncbi:MAG TPA: calcium-binding protein [Actinomycetota bacterium]|nr:calcium-binding protein [Actinomycetota bacterium]